MRNILSVIILVAACISCTKNQELAVNPRCEYAVNPQGIDVLSPRFNWEISSEERNVLQVSYQILVASSPERLERNEGDLWDSGIVNTDETLGVVYKGKALQSRDRCFWKVKVTTNTGNTGWSKPAEWTMGLLSSQDWQAKWAGLEEAYEGDTTTGEHTRLAARYLRKEFPADKKVQQATLYISGLGLYEAYGDWCMPPESPELIHSKDPSRITEKEVLGTTYYYKCFSMLQEFALLLDKLCQGNLSICKERNKNFLEERRRPVLLGDSDSGKYFGRHLYSFNPAIGYQRRRERPGYNRRDNGAWI